MRIDGVEIDRGVWYLVATNLFAAGTALATGLAIADLLLVYWAHCVLIGLGTVVRILRHPHFSVNGMSGLSGATLAEKTAEKLEMAGFFALFYGIFCIASLAIIYIGLSPTAPDKNPLAFVACVAVFALQYGWEVVQSLRTDAADMSRINDVIVLPALTLFPLFLVCAITGQVVKGGGGESGGLLGLALLTFYKTCADVIVHCFERDRQKRDYIS